MPTIPPINIKKLHEFPERSGFSYDDLLHVNSTELDYKIQATKVADFVQADLFYDTLAELIAETDTEKVKVGKRVTTFLDAASSPMLQIWEIVPAATGTADNIFFVELTGTGLQAKRSPIKLFDSEWDRFHIVIGNFHLWFDGSNNLRAHSSAPTSATDGVVVVNVP